MVMWSASETEGIVRSSHFQRDLLVFANRPKNWNEILRRTASRFPDKEALVMDESRISYREMLEVTEFIASHLYHDHGIRKGDRVAVLLGNCIEYPLLFFACSRIGAITILLNTRLGNKELEYLLEQSKPKILFTNTEFATNVENFNLASIKFIVGDDRGFHSFVDLCVQIDSAPSIDINEEDPLYIMYTSGTTGIPKGAVGSHLGTIHSVICYHRIFKTTESDRSLDAVPLFHVTGLMGQLLHMVFIGGTNVLMKRFKAPEFNRLLSEENITFSFNVPTVYVMMMSDPSFDLYSYETVKILAYGGAPMSPQTIKQLKKAFHGVRLHNAYGATETSSPTTVMPSGYQEKKITSVGLPIPVIEVKIVDSQGEVCPPLQVGELWIKGPNVVSGYWENEEANRHSFAGDYWRSGDLALMDEDGFIYIMDRMKDMINRGGEKIFSVEVENVLYSHPKVLEAAVVGIPDEVFGEQVKAVVVTKEGERLTALEIQQFLKGFLADYKVPKVVEFWKELPRNPGGKVIKSLLKDTYSIEQERSS